MFFCFGRSLAASAAGLPQALPQLFADVGCSKMAGERVGNFLDDMEPAAVAAPLPIKVLLSDQDDAELLILDDGQVPKPS